MSAPSEQKPTLARHDLWTGLAMALIGAAFSVESWRMPRLEERGIDPWTAPGIVPGVLGTALAVLGVVLALRGWRELGTSGGRPSASVIGAGAGRRRFLIALALNLAYALLLVGLLPYWLATGAYLLAFMMIFGLAPAEPGASVRGAVFLAVAALATTVVVYMFQTLFFVRLP